MLNVIITWLALDVVAIAMILYDFRRWYDSHETVPEQGKETEADVASVSSRAVGF